MRIAEHLDPENPSQWPTVTVPAGHDATYTAELAGTILLAHPNGTQIAYDLSPDIITHPPEHTGAINCAIERGHQATGKFGPDWTHTCTDKCAIPPDAPTSAAPPVTAG